MKNLINHRSDLFNKELLQKIINEGEDDIVKINTLKIVGHPEVSNWVYALPVYKGKLSHFQFDVNNLPTFKDEKEYSDYCDKITSKEENVEYVKLYVDFLEGVPDSTKGDEMYQKHLDLDYEVLIYFVLS